MNKKTGLYAFGVAIAAFLILMLLTRCSSGSTLILGIDPAQQKNIVPEFIELIKSGDNDAAMEYVSNYDSFGFERTSTELVELYKQKLTDSYSVRVISVGSEIDSTLTSSQVIELTFLDSRLLLPAINEKTAESVNAYLYGGDLIENDDQALEFVYAALYECLDSPELYYTTERLTVQTVFDGEKWQIVADTSFINAMYGYAGSISADTEIPSQDTADTTEDSSVVSAGEVS